MNPDLDFDLAFYGAILVGLGVVAHRLVPDFGSVNLMTTMAGGVAATFWGVLGLRGFRRRHWPIGTLIAVDFVLSIQVIRAWLGISGGNDGFKPAAVILTVLWALGIGQLVNFAQEHRRER